MRIKNIFNFISIRKCTCSHIVLEKWGFALALKNISIEYVQTLA